MVEESHCIRRWTRWCRVSSLGDNIKVHFAGSDNDMTAYAGLMTAEVKYNLYSCYPFIVSKKKMMILKWAIE